MPARERFLLLLTIVGFVVPNVMVAIFIADHGVDPGRYLGGWFEVLPAAQITIDLLIVAVALLAWSAWDARQNRVERWWVILPATFLVGLCFGAPLYLLMRERALRGVAARQRPGAAPA